MNKNTVNNINPIDEFVGNRIKIRRGMLKISQELLASQLGLTFQQIQKYESGANRVSASRLYILAKILKVSVSYFFESLDKDEKVLNYYNSFINDNHSNVSVIAEDKLEFNSCDKSSDDFIDPMLHTDSLQLISSYWKIKDPDTRKKILDLVKSLSNSN